MKSIFFKTISTLLFVYSLTGCSTMYQPQGYTGGYSETRLSDNIFQVSFKGNKYTSMEQTTDFVLLRSSELTIQNNFKYFVIINTENYNKIGGDSESIYVKPSSNNKIMCFTEKPNVNGVVYDSEYIIKSIKQKYDIK